MYVVGHVDLRQGDVKRTAGSLVLKGALEVGYARLAELCKGVWVGAVWRTCA